MQRCVKFASPLIVLITLVALVTIFWKATLFSGKVLAHGDSILHGLSLWDYYSQNINHLNNLLWDSNTYGGHPLFAEGQGCFAFPLNALLVRFITPIHANSFAHWLEMILAGIALYGLSRTLKLSVWASGFVVLAAVFSSSWLQIQQNMTVGAAALCIPWFIWCAECWIQKPTIKTAIFLAIAAALSIFGGYPHYLQGSILYVVVSILPSFFEKNSRNIWRENFASTLKTGLVAILIGIGLAAVQLLPLLELIQYSHRAAGTTPGFFELPFAAYIRGSLYNLRQHELDFATFIPVIGSSLVSLAFTLILFFKLPVRIKGHLFSTILLLNLGMGATSPITSFLYNYHLIPGMHYFRVMMPYFIVASVGVAIISGFSIDRLTFSLCHFDRRKIGSIFSKNRTKIAAGVFVAFWLFTLYKAGFNDPIEIKQITLATLGISATIILTIIKRAALIPIFLFFLLAMETAIFKTDEFVFIDKSALEKPVTAKIIGHDDPQKNYKLYSTSITFLYAMGSPHQKMLTQNVKNMLSHLCGLSNLRWDIPSMMGASALALREKAFIDPILEQEANGHANSTPGLRLIDLLSVKYITADSLVEGPGFRVQNYEPATNTWLIENTAAKPRFQIYTNYVFSKSSQDALNALQSTKIPLLTLQTTEFMSSKSSGEIAPATTDTTPPIKFSLTKNTHTHYEFSTQSTQPGWLFLADSNYPGWHAYIDGIETPVYTAQILGKAIYIPSGNHNAELLFRSDSFNVGLRITLLTLCVSVIFGIIRLTSRNR